MRAYLKTAFQALILTLVAQTLHAAQLEHHEPNLGEIRVVPVDPTPEPDQVKVRVVFPEDDEMENSLPIGLQIRVEGYPLRVSSDFPRSREIVDDPNGQSLQLVIDNREPLSLYETLIDSNDDVEEYYDQTLNYDIPFSLEPGMHVIRAFPVRSYYESLKGDGCFATSVFYYKTNKKIAGVDLNQPFLTYNSPQERVPYSARKPVLLDFYITNCQLSKDGYKVRVTFDSKDQRILNQWVPYYVYGLSKGKHKIKLELLDEKNNVVPGIYNSVERSFQFN